MMRFVLTTGLGVAAFVAVLASLLGRGGAQGEWNVGQYRESKLEGRGDGPAFRGSGGAGAGPAVKLEQATIIRPRVVPGDRAVLVARYVVSTAAPVDVKETRTVRYNDQVLLTREKVTKRTSGEWRSEYDLPIPTGAADGLYALTTRVETVGQGGASVEKSTMFTVEPAPGAKRPPAAGDAEIRISLWTEKTRYRIGEMVTFHFETNRDGYVMLVNAGTSGDVTMLFPNRFSEGQTVKAKTRHSVPRPEDAYTMTVSGPPGIDLVYALFSLQPMKFAEADFSRTRSIFRDLGKETPTLTRNINVVMKQTPVEKRARDAIELEVVGP